ncbi:ribonuclease H-like domain-containing protein [Burkholderia vietnamiensis]|uniref:ribonuclease H-like domain-containing protein n=1 Tax=Burkholderia vietnamiensis TaxID=60552 RepID=UPI00158A9643|nr:ribonuclease H-like domain-containing protein [Burkholderia vietnamiensis]
MTEFGNSLIYDLEIAKAILGRGEDRVDGIQYCDGWHDHAGMGISVIGAYDYAESRYRVFCADNIVEFLELCDARAPLVSFNGIGFDDKVINAYAKTAIHGSVAMPREPFRYDLLAEIWRAAGLDPTFGGNSHTGYGLDATCEVNFGIRKSGNGAHAPIAWQQGRVGEVIDYCLNDIRLTKRLFDHAVVLGEPIVLAKTGASVRLRTIDQVERTYLA